MKYPEYKNLDLIAVAKEVQTFWENNHIFEKSIATREDQPSFTFYEGPPSVNGYPGIHHVLGRAVKDIFCRYKTLQGYKVRRKSGWDTHGLPVELQVEKRLGISKDDIGQKISVAQYNEECRKDVLQYKDAWEEMTKKLGFWLDFDDVYITYSKDYIETLWYLLKRFHEKGLLYRDFSIQPYSPAAGTALSSHELNMPGCYCLIKDVSLTAQFKVHDTENEYLLAWTTTPWTLPSNTGLAVGKDIEYVKVQTYNQYTYEPIIVYLAKETMSKFFKPENAELNVEGYEPGQKEIPYQVLDSFPGKEMEEMRYEQLLPYVQPEEGDPFRVVTADFVSTEEGTGIVHIAPTFGDDDFKVGKQKNLPPLTVPDPDNSNRPMPLVSKKGQFVDQVDEFAGRYVKNFTDDENFEDVNVDIAVKLKKENRAFNIEKYEHNYPHCWRTDKPLLYYPLDAWFIKSTALKDRMIELNQTINWKPSSTGEGRFGNWLENMVDWNLSRDRYWGTPLPVWLTEDGTEVKCIGSFEELKQEVDKAIEAGFDQEPITGAFDPHRPYVDEVTLVSDYGKPMKRVTDVIDVWFDSGAMPYAQWHYPFENQEIFNNNFPADFIAEGVDQTRGWFYTLHAIASMLFDSTAYKNVIANGLVLDKDGNKMSKRLGNVIDPFEILDNQGPDATRWYMVHNAQLWDNLKFDPAGVDETKRKLFGTIFNVYSFFSLYANIDEFVYSEAEIPVKERPEIDRWIISFLNSLIRDYQALMDEYEPTKAVRRLQEFVVDHLSNWYVRLCRRRFWKGDYSLDKIAAYQTLYRCLEVTAQLMAPFSPYYAERLFKDLNDVTGRHEAESVHLSYLPAYDGSKVDHDLEERMDIAQEITSLALSLRKKADIRVRQPLNKLMIPVMDHRLKEQIEQVRELILNEVNVKDIEFITDTSAIMVKKVKPDFKKLGPKYGQKIKGIQKALASLDQKSINEFERNESMDLTVDDEIITLRLDDVEILSEDIPGWLVSSTGKLTVAMDITITDELKYEGITRELVNRVQNLRKQRDLEVTDNIELIVENHPELAEAIERFRNYICRETLANSLSLDSDMKDEEEVSIEDLNIKINLKKV